MAILDIIRLPDPVLREKSVPVESIDAETLGFMDSMLETMYDAPGIGLAAIQVGVPRRIVTIDIVRDEEERGNPMFFINPEIVQSSETRSAYDEGCLSIPDYYAEVERPAEVTVKFLNRDGQEETIEASGLLATCLQHEIDHLDGVLFIDHLSRLKRQMVIRKFTKMARDEAKKL